MDNAIAIPENVNVGDILYATYNYNRVSHHFYKVIAKRGKLTIMVQPLENIFNGGQNSGTEMPGDLTGKAFSVRYGKRGFRVDKYLDKLRIWNGDPLEFSSWD